LSPIDPQEAQVTGWHSFGKAASNDADHNYMSQRAGGASQTADVGGGGLLQRSYRGDCTHSARDRFVLA